MDFDYVQVLIRMMRTSLEVLNVDSETEQTGAAGLGLEYTRLRENVPV